MYVLELSFDDDPRRLDERAAHRERLAALHDSGKLAMAGPLENDSGALLVFSVDDEQAVRELMAADPYYRAPGVTVRGVRRWDPIVP